MFLLAVCCRATLIRAARGLLQPQWVFVVLSVVFGCAYLLVTPPCQVPDETYHFDRAFELSEGRIIPVKQGNLTGDYLPRDVEHLRQVFGHLDKHPEQKTSVAEIRSAAVLAIDEDRVFTNFPNTAVYPPLAYLPQALGIAVARLFSSSVLVCFYAGRLGNLLAATALFFLAIRVAPIGKWAFVALALTPMALFESASLSSDALTNAFAFLLVGSLLRYACGPVERLGGKDVAILAVLVMALALVKQGYLLLVLAYFLIPEARLGGRKRYWRVFALLLGCELLAAGGWALIVRDVYSPVVPGKINPAAQVRDMIEHPGGFLSAVVRSSTVDVPGTLREYLGFLGLLDTPLSDRLLLLQGLVLVLTALMGFGQPGTVTARQTLVALTTVLVTYLSILTVIHITWDAVGFTDSIDVQGRYFIPLGPLVAFGLGGVGQRLPAWMLRPRSILPTLTTIAVPCIMVAALHTLFERYYIDTPLAAAERHFDQGQKILKEGGETQQAQEQFEEAVRLNLQHSAAHFNLGNLLAASQPRKAIAHYREAVRLDPDNVQIRNNLANTLARQGLFEEAITHYKVALQLAPGEEAIRKNLQNTEHLQDQLQRALPRIFSLIQACAQGNQIEKRYAGTTKEAFYLKPNQGEVLTPVGTPPLPKTRYVWRVPPPSGEPIRAPLEKDARVGELAHRPFFACSMDPVGLRRVFVFPPPRKAVLFSDEEVSWYFQLPMDQLNPDEQAREREYRRQQGLRFPLDLRLPPH
ncbi:MAG TPA: DUF2142 domain-containing protein [Gemmataceae bacterium]|nr:DUF2142 domain-containing protein [Gemmataceae bacterium]